MLSHLVHKPMWVHVSTFRHLHFQPQDLCPRPPGYRTGTGFSSVFNPKPVASILDEMHPRGYIEIERIHISYVVMAVTFLWFQRFPPPTYPGKASRPVKTGIPSPHPGQQSPPPWTSLTPTISEKPHVATYVDTFSALSAVTFCRRLVTTSGHLAP